MVQKIKKSEYNFNGERKEKKKKKYTRGKPRHWGMIHGPANLPAPIVCLILPRPLGSQNQYSPFDFRATPISPLGHPGARESITGPRGVFSTL